MRGLDVDLRRSVRHRADPGRGGRVRRRRHRRVTGIGFIRRKETDRIGAVVAELQPVRHRRAEEEPDGFVDPTRARPRRRRIETYDDHRMAMSFALLGLRVAGIDIADPGCVAKTFPGFWELLETLAARRGRRGLGSRRLA